MTPEQLSRLITRIVNHYDSAVISGARIGLGIALDYIFEELDNKKHLSTDCEEILERARAYAKPL